MQEICSSNPPVVTVICDPNRSRSRHHRSLKLGSKLKYLNYERDFNKELIKRFANIYELCNEDINKFILLLRKGVYPYEYMGSWERFAERLFSDKEAFYSSLNMEGITDVDNRHAKRVLKNFNNKNTGDYHDLYVQSDTLLLADVFENFRNKCIEIFEQDPANFLSAPGLAWQACLKIRSKIRIVN